MGQDSGTSWKGMEKEMDVPGGAWCKSFHSVFWVSVLSDQSGLGLFPDNHTLLQLRESHNEMGMPKEGFCRDLTHSVVPDH